MNKVYCKNCKWFRDSECAVGSIYNPYFTKYYIDKQGYESCKWINIEEYQKELKKYEIHFSSNYTPITISCCNFNNDYNCKYYNRKWYKFWVK